MNDALKALRLVLVQTTGSGMDLVSLAHRQVLASGERLVVGPDTTTFVIGENEEQEARKLAGLPEAEGWPGWDVIFDYLDHKDFEKAVEVTFRENHELLARLGD